MTDVEMKIEAEDFSEELNDEALDREGAVFMCACAGACALTSR